MRRETWAVIIATTALFLDLVIAIAARVDAVDDRDSRATAVAAEAITDAGMVALQETVIAVMNPAPNITVKNAEITAVKAARSSTLNLFGTMISVEVDISLENVRDTTDWLKGISPGALPSQLQRTAPEREAIELQSVLGEGKMRINGFGDNKEDLGQKRIALPPTTPIDVSVSVALCQSHSIAENGDTDPVEFAKAISGYDALAIHLALDFSKAGEVAVPIELSLTDVSARTKPFSFPTYFAICEPSEQ